MNMDNQSWWDYKKEKKKKRGPLSVWIKKPKPNQNPAKTQTYSTLSLIVYAAFQK